MCGEEMRVMMEMSEWLRCCVWLGELGVYVEWVEGGGSTVNDG